MFDFGFILKKILKILFLNFQVDITFLVLQIKKYLIEEQLRKI